MQTEYKDGKLVLDPCDLFENMPAEQLLLLVQSLSAQEAVIKHVADQIIHGWTEDGYSGRRIVGVSTEPTDALDIAIRRIAEASGDIAKQEIQRLVNEIKCLDKRLREAYDQLHEYEKAKSKARPAVAVY